MPPTATATGWQRAASTPRTARPATWASASPATLRRPGRTHHASAPPSPRPACPIGSVHRAGVEDPDHDRRGGAPMAHPTFENARGLSDWEPPLGVVSVY